MHKNIAPTVESPTAPASMLAAQNHQGTKGLKRMRANFKPGQYLNKECTNCGMRRYNLCGCQKGK